ncbi:transcriptional repressor NrdR [Candidatus Peregrinibacteria bacterium]|nr:transcriptional repressor NrdR [Candidatus Peregrinibacteria bacterium]
MYCPKCKNLETRVIDSRDADENRAIRRRRECEKCQYRFTTFEHIEAVSFIVIKKDGSRESYQREKLENGIWKACEKRPVSQEQIHTLIDEIEENLSHNGKERESRELGELVMEKLKKIDEVAYIRFASVYRHFTDLESFKTELNKLLKTERDDHPLHTNISD